MKLIILKLMRCALLLSQAKGLMKTIINLVLLKMMKKSMHIRRKLETFLMLKKQVNCEFQIAQLINKFNNKSKIAEKLKLQNLLMIWAKFKI